MTRETKTLVLVLFFILCWYSKAYVIIGYVNENCTTIYEYYIYREDYCYISVYYKRISPSLVAEYLCNKGCVNCHNKYNYTLGECKEGSYFVLYSYTKDQAFETRVYNNTECKFMEKKIVHTFNSNELHCQLGYKGSSKVIVELDTVYILSCEDNNCLVKCRKVFFKCPYNIVYTHYSGDTLESPLLSGTKKIDITLFGLFLIVLIML